MGFLAGLIVRLMTIGVEIGASLVAAIPLTIAWNALAPIYGHAWLPALFMHFTFWQMWGTLLILALIGNVVNQLTPKIVSISKSMED